MPEAIARLRGVRLSLPPVPSRAEQLDAVINIKRGSRRYSTANPLIDPDTLPEHILEAMANPDMEADADSNSDISETLASPVPEEYEGVAKEPDDVQIVEELDMDRHERVLRVLSKAPEQRSSAELTLLQDATADVKFFERLTSAQHLELCRVMTHERLDKEECVFSQGDEGTTFYVIYLGATKVYIKELGGALARSKGACVCVLEDGDSFGELALLGNGIRNATVVTAIPTILLKVEKDAYEQSLQKLHEADLQQRMIFLQRVFIFSDWTEQDLRKIAYVMTPRKFEKNTTVIKQGEGTDSMFFLVEGTCRVLQRMSLSGRQLEMLGLGTAGSCSPRSGSSSPRVPHVLEICRLNQHQYFGELAMLDKGEHTASVVTVTPVEVLILSKYDFYHHVDARTQETMHSYARKFYMDDAAIRMSIEQQFRWQTYKKGLLDDVVARRSRMPSPRNSPRAERTAS